MNMDGVAELLKELRQSAEFILRLPKALLTLLPELQISYMERKERIRVLKEIVELREFGKELQDLYFFKGGLLEFAKDCAEGDADDEHIAGLKELFGEMHLSLERIRSSVSDFYFAQTSIAVEALLFLARASGIFRRLSLLPNAALRDKDSLIEICSFMEKTLGEASEFIEELDNQRKLLDYSYG
jgi:hypothetical protein